MIKNKTHKLIITAAVSATLCVGGSAYFLASANNSFTNNKDVNISSSTSNEATTEITAEEAKNIALEKAGEGYTVKEIELDKDLLKSEYELELKNDTYEIDAEINASTGEVTKWDIETHDDHKVPLNVNNSTASEAISSQKEIITESKAKEIALAKAGKGYTITSIELDRDDNETDYDIELENGSKEIDAEIDAYTGKILKWEIDTIDDDEDRNDHYDDREYYNDIDDDNKPQSPEQGSKKLSVDEVKQIALKKAGSGYKVTDIELDEDDGRLVYELELVNSSYEVDAYSGEVIVWDKELDD